MNGLQDREGRFQGLAGFLRFHVGASAVVTGFGKSGYLMAPR